MARKKGESADPAANVEMDVTVELGRTTLPLEFLLNCSEGSLIELPESNIEPGKGTYTADVRANGALVARGEIVVIAENFGARVVETLASPEDRAS